MYIAVNDQTVITVRAKVGSMSIMGALYQIPHQEVTPEEALTYQNRVMFLRHPITRINSVFNHFWWLSLNHADYNEFIPTGTIKAWAHRVDGGIGVNEHHFKGPRITRFLEKLEEERTAGYTDQEIKLRLNNADYRRFIDYVLSGNDDAHWLSQVAQSEHNGIFVPNIVHKFNEINTHWPVYVGGTLPQENAWQPIQHSEYRLPELRSYYQKDLDKWAEL